jgi:hypothetical protein
MVTRESPPAGISVNDAVNDKRTFRKIISLLYDSNMENRLFAAQSLGQIARINPELIKKRWPRIFYAFDDTMSCWGVAEGLGEIARNLPELRGKIVIHLNKFKRDAISCQGFIWAICRIGQVDNNIIRDLLPEVMRDLDSKDICLLGQSIWAAGELKIKKTSEKIKTYLNDERETWIYENNSACIKTIGKISEEALKKLDNIEK